MDPASLRAGFCYKREIEGLTIQTREHLSYPEVERLMTDKFIRSLLCFAAEKAEIRAATPHVNTPRFPQAQSPR